MVGCFWPIFLFCGSQPLRELAVALLPWCINTGKSLIPLTLLFFAPKRNLLIPLELSRVMHQGSGTSPFDLTGGLIETILYVALSPHTEALIARKIIFDRQILLRSSTIKPFASSSARSPFSV